ncbi:hypothetical protein NIES4071_12640 [Calothrix sp. NIES-4071]|nr:hypothetical protein NIES4071_12640 [Calothrix sp. NIES-4071]BAZ55604.1 hypothetical protein NIES4105_12600 [Calothrix sp. NIES-4105]
MSNNRSLMAPFEFQDGYSVAFDDTVQKIENYIHSENFTFESKLREANQNFLLEKQRLTQIQKVENSQNWLWYQISKIEANIGDYRGSVSVEAIRELAIIKAPVPEDLKKERSEAVARASEFVLKVALKALEQEGKEVIPSVKIVTVLGYTIIYNSETQDLSIDKVNQAYMRHNTGKIEKSYRPDGIFKAKGQEVSLNLLLTKDLANFDYIECKQLTKECLPLLRNIVESYAKEDEILIEIWSGRRSEEAKMKKTSGKIFVSIKAGMQIIESGKHLQVRDLEGKLTLKAYGDKVDKPMTRTFCQDFKARYALMQQVKEKNSVSLK